MPENFFEHILLMQIISYIVLAIVIGIMYLVGLFKEGKYFSYHGRLNRWAFFKKLFFCFFTSIVIVIPSLLIVVQKLNTLDTAFYVIMTIITSPFYAYVMVMSIKRLHDLNISGKLFIAYVAVLLIFNTIIFALVGPDPNKVLLLQDNIIFKIISIISSIINLALLITLFFIRGSKGENKYGPDPLEKTVM